MGILCSLEITEFSKVTQFTFYTEPQAPLTLPSQILGYCS